jgi:hypothetical protein
MMTDVANVIHWHRRSVALRAPPYKKSPDSARAAVLEAALDRGTFLGLRHAAPDNVQTGFERNV